jgi:type II secretory pathway pseudopilin PulG
LKRRRGGGFSYLEMLAAVLLLALCAAPAADAVKTALAAPTIAGAKMRELRCMKNQMETVLAEPYQNLWNAARGQQLATSYSRPADANCGARNVYIAKYQAEYGKAPVFLPYPDTATEIQLEAVLLYVTVSSPATSYTFTTLVAR